MLSCRGLVSASVNQQVSKESLQLIWAEKVLEVTGWVASPGCQQFLSIWKDRKLKRLSTLYPHPGAWFAFWWF